VLVSSASSLLSHFLDTIRRLRVQGPLWLWQGAGCIYHIPNNSAFVETQTLFLKVSPEPAYLLPVGLRSRAT